MALTSATVTASDESTRYDAIVVGAGTSGGTMARDLAEEGLRVLVLEAGPHLSRETYPRNELDGNSWLYWGGGVELNTDASIGTLRPRVVGGGGIVNQALMDRFDDIALDDFRAASGVDFFRRDAMAPYYEQAESRMALEEVPEQYRNRNAEIFAEGFARNGYRVKPLRRAESNCHFEEGNSCVECLGGCRIDSKQSPNVTSIPKALAAGARLISQMEVGEVAETADGVVVRARGADGVERTFRGARLVLASGAIGNSKLLLSSGFDERLPRIGHDYYTHPQYMNLALYDEPVGAFRGPLQNYKSDDAGFRRQGFKLENVFAGPVGIAMLVPGIAREHSEVMAQLDHLACVEVCVRDTTPGRIRIAKGATGVKGAIGTAPVIDKRLGDEDKRRRDHGMDAIRNIFYSTGAKKIIPGRIGIGLHLMGGLGMGQGADDSVVGADFRLHGSRRIWAADSSIFPNAPGVNPSLTIQALSIKAAETIVKESR
ncbi:FAD-dependent oxidoreductase [Janibacter sp. GXQ6167]|uniref:FAD-dependent oxidoreductase n=1 Tax=Janibacter sp. GXQ6167 TaxID=3240791 RepID=UPI0035244442